MNRAKPGRNWLAPAARLVDALTDPECRERAVVLTLIAYVAIWSLYGAFAKGSQDIHFDMGEVIAWSREAGIGTPKHPPLSAWLARAWFGVFPYADWAYYLFAMTVAGAGLWIAWRASEPYLDAEKRVVGLALLSLLPLYNFHALKYNANSVLIPLWAATAWCFLRSFETRSIVWAAFAGVAAAAAMLGKYWSIFLLAGLGVAALADPRRMTYFRSAAPWVTIAAGAIAFAPHAAWIVASNFAPFGYALDAHPASGFGDAAIKALGFLGGVLGYVAPAIVLAFMVAWPGRQMSLWPGIADTAWPPTPERRLVAIAFYAPIILPALAALAARLEVVSLWAMSAMTLVPIVLLSSPFTQIVRQAAVWLVAFAIAFPVLMTLASPIIAVVIHREGVSNYATHYHLIAKAVQSEWRKATDRPLKLVGSYTNVVNGILFYLDGRPSTLDIVTPRHTPWTDEARVARDGIALVCPQSHADCMRELEKRTAAAPGARRSEVVISRTHFGHADAAVKYVIVIVPPRS